MTRLPSPFEIHSQFYRDMEARARRKKLMRGAVSIAAALLIACILGIMLFALWNTWQAEHTTSQFCTMQEALCR